MNPYTHACKARPLTTVGRTSLSVIIIFIIIIITRHAWTHTHDYSKLSGPSLRPRNQQHDSAARLCTRAWHGRTRPLHARACRNTSWTFCFCYFLDVSISPDKEGAEAHALWPSGHVRALCTGSWLDWSSSSSRTEGTDETQETDENRREPKRTELPVIHGQTHARELSRHAKRGSD